MHPKILWPNNKKFAFTIFDDTDRANLKDIQSVYECLDELGFKTTKSAWVARGKYDHKDKGITCEDKTYLNWLLELKKNGVTSIAFVGPMEVGSLNVIGKGYVGIVILAKIKNEVFALKIRRSDSPRKKMNDEAKLLQIANKVNVGPKLIKFSKNFLKNMGKKIFFVAETSGRTGIV